MIRFVNIEKCDILTDPEEAADILNHAVRRKRPMRFSGLCDANSETLLVVLEEIEETKNVAFVFSPFPSESTDEITATVESRYLAGYSTLGTFRLGDMLWGLFAKE